jgi:NAD(P)-dependent dehydrogenase (short-subunit alcohol dehydrogenase family)
MPQISNNRTIFITGASSGIGRASALLFQKKGWNVIATMRSPEKETTLNTLDRVLCTRLDVTDDASISAAVAAGSEKFTRIDVVLNNAGYGLTGPFEATTPETVRKQFDTNVFGSMNVIRALLPHFRANANGTILNVTSMGGRIALPLYSVYHATKWAMEGFSESLQYELQPFNIRVKMIEPGAIATQFYDRSLSIAKREGVTAYDTMVANTLERMNASGRRGASPDAVATVIYRAATDGSWKQRYPAAGNARAILWTRKLLPDWLFSAMLRGNLMKK